MEWELDFIKFLQRGSVPFLDWLLYFITQFGTEIFFMLVVMALYWCVNKREGFRLVNLFMVANLFVGVIKVIVRRTRPYHFEGIRGILEQTSGYSFPSGHSDNIGVVATSLTMQSKAKGYFKAAVIASCIIVPLVMFSRVYLGQHYPTDVLTGALIGVGIGIAGYILFDKILGNNEEKIIFAVLPLCLLLFAAAVAFYAFRGETPDSLMNIAGTYSAVAIGYYIEKTRIKYDVKSDKFWHYIVRFALGAICVLTIKEGLKVLFGLFASGIWRIIFDFIRYFIIGIFVTLLAPMLFKKLKI